MFTSEQSAMAWLKRRAPGINPVYERDTPPDWHDELFVNFWALRTPHRPVSVDYMILIAQAARDERLEWDYEPGTRIRRGTVEGRGLAVHDGLRLRCTIGKGAPRWEIFGRPVKLAQVEFLISI